MALRKGLSASIIVSALTSAIIAVGCAGLQAETTAKSAKTKNIWENLLNTYSSIVCSVRFALHVLEYCCNNIRVKFMRMIILSLVATVLLSCGGRSAAPVAIERATDADLTCEHIRSEGHVNLTRIEGLVGEGDLATAQNVAFLLVIPVVALPLLLDLSSAERDEIKALEQRNQRLAQIGANKGCDLST